MGNLPIGQKRKVLGSDQEYREHAFLGEIHSPAASKRPFWRCPTPADPEFGLRSTTRKVGLRRVYGH